MATYGKKRKGINTETKTKKGVPNVFGRRAVFPDKKKVAVKKKVAKAAPPPPSRGQAMDRGTIDGMLYKSPAEREAIMRELRPKPKKTGSFDEKFKPGNTGRWRRKPPRK